MKLLKPLFALFVIAALSSCNTPNRPKVHDIVQGTPTNADTVLYRSQTHPNDSLTNAKPLPRVFHR